MQLRPFRPSSRGSVYATLSKAAIKETEPPKAELKFPSASLPKSIGRFQGAKKEPFKMIERPQV
jgi:hypothetical protein